MMRAVAIVCAGGSGQRLGIEGGKQLALVAGRPVLAWTLSALDASEEVDHIVLVCPDDRVAEYRAAAVDSAGAHDSDHLRAEWRVSAGVGRRRCRPRSRRCRDTPRARRSQTSRDAGDRDRHDRGPRGRPTRCGRGHRPAGDRHAQDRERGRHRRDARPLEVLGGADATDVSRRCSAPRVRRAPTPTGSSAPMMRRGRARRGQGIACCGSPRQHQGDSRRRRRARRSDARVSRVQRRSSRCCVSG